jgi:hypothetical protein
MPEFEVVLESDKIREIKVVRGAPCGGTWEAASKVIGMRAADAPEALGLEIQFFCFADPAGWDVIHGRSPVHFAGSVHSKALERAVKKVREGV